MWSGIEVVITGLTRNQLGRKVSWVRIPPAPPHKKESTQVSTLFYNSYEINTYPINIIKDRPIGLSFIIF